MTTTTPTTIRQDTAVTEYLRSAKDMTMVLLDGASETTLAMVRDAVTKGQTLVLETVYRPGGSFVPSVRLLLQDKAGERLAVSEVEFVADECAATH